MVVTNTAGELCANKIKWRRTDMEVEVTQEWPYEIVYHKTRQRMELMPGLVSCGNKLLADDHRFVGWMWKGWRRCKLAVILSVESVSENIHSAVQSHGNAVASKSNGRVGSNISELVRMAGQEEGRRGGCQEARCQEEGRKLEKLQVKKARICRPVNHLW